LELSTKRSIEKKVKDKEGKKGKQYLIKFFNIKYITLTKVLQI